MKKKYHCGGKIGRRGEEEEEEEESEGKAGSRQRQIHTASL